MPTTDQFDSDRVGPYSSEHQDGYSYWTEAQNLQSNSDWYQRNVEEQQSSQPRTEAHGGNYSLSQLPPLPPNPYSNRTDSRAAPLNPAPPRPPALAYPPSSDAMPQMPNQSWRDPQYPNYLSAMAARQPSTVSNGPAGAANTTHQRSADAFAPASLATTTNDYAQHRESTMSGIISMYARPAEAASSNSFQQHGSLENYRSRDPHDLMTTVQRREDETGAWRQAPASSPHADILNGSAQMRPRAGPVELPYRLSATHLPANSLPSPSPSIPTPSAWSSSYSSTDDRANQTTPFSSYLTTPPLVRGDSVTSLDFKIEDVPYLHTCLLSHLASDAGRLVPKRICSKGTLQHAHSFSGADFVDTIERNMTTSGSRSSRKDALAIARTLHESLWIHEIDWADTVLQDTPQQVFVLTSNGMPDAMDSSGLAELPTGIYTRATPCYSPYCQRMSESGYSAACYSPSCPNRSVSRLEREGSTLSQVAVDKGEEAENWASSVPSSVLDSLTKDEIHYQNAAYELIQGEIMYLRDLELIDKAFVQPLKTSNPPIIPHSRLDSFLREVLLNLDEIREYSRRFVDGLLAKQREAYVIHNFGKLMLSAVVEWAAAYTEFTVNFPMADWILKNECASNSRLNGLILSFSKRPEAARRGFDSFHNRVTPRGLRYDLLLGQMYKCVSVDDPDREYIAQAMAVLKQQAHDANRQIEATRGRVALREYERDLWFKPGEYVELDLSDKTRRFYKSGKILRRPDGTGFTDWTEAHLILLDHYIVTTKLPRERDGRIRYPLARRPVPLDLVQLRASSFSEPPITRSSGFHLRSARMAGIDRNPSSSSQLNSATHIGNETLAFPISFYQLGRFNGPVYFFVESQAERADWERHLKAAIESRLKRQEANRAIRLEPLADQVFGAPAVIGSLSPEVPASNQFGRPTCSCPLTTADGQSLIIAGCSEGLFIGFRGRPQTVRQVVHLSGITQVAVMPAHGFVLVLANRVLIAYSLEALIPTGSKSDPALKAPQRLSGQKDVSFFRAGCIGDVNPRTLVIYAKKSGVKESVFKALEPVTHNDRAKPGNHRFLGFGKASPDWFRAHKEFFMPTLVNSVQFHRSKLALVGLKGVEIMDLDSMRTMTVPSFPSLRQDKSLAQLAKRCEDSHTMGMFRLQDSKFLIVYDDFGFHVGRHGEPVEGPSMEWETKPESVAYCAPFLYLFSPNIIEVRNAFTGRLAQFIIGSQIGLTFDGAGLSSSTQEPRSPQVAGLGELDRDRHIHCTMRVGSYHVLYEIVALV